MIIQKLLFMSSILCTVLLTCTTSKQFVMEKPQEGKCLVTGAVLLENNGIDDKYETKFSNITVVVVGKFIENGEEKTEGFRTNTDENGYFLLQNVPCGTYVLKGFEADVGFDTRLFVSSRWDGSTQIFYTGNTLIDFTVRHWTETQTGTLTDLEINYFMIDRARRIAHEKFKQLEDKPGTFPDTIYNMINPLEYFKLKYPQWEWFLK
jgi:hypothetical protein